MSYKLRLFLISILFAGTTSAAYAADETKDPYENNLLGSLGGQRSKLSDAGLDVTLEYKADFFSTTSGGIKRGGNYLDNTDLKLALDGEKLLGIHGNKALIYLINNNGSKPNESRVGSTQGVDNIEVATNTLKLYEAWVDQSFLADKLSLLLGLHDLNSEFAATDMTVNFIKPVMQIGQTFAQSGKNAPSIFPNTSLAARIKIAPTDVNYISMAAFDGVPGNPGNRHGTHIDLNSNDGMLLVAETGFIPKMPDIEGDTPNKFALGAWEYTKKMDDMVDVDAKGTPVKNTMHGLYAISSYKIYNNKQAGHDLGVFLRGGMSDENTAQVDWDYEFGLVGSGWVPTRPDGEIGIGFAQAHNTDKYRQSKGGEARRSEYSTEIYYRDKIYRGISIQPDLQYVINPATDTATKNATIIGIRFDVNF
jgi:porin